MTLDELAKVLEAGTPGPWESLPDGFCADQGQRMIWSEGVPRLASLIFDEANARKIVAAVNLGPALVAVARAAENLRGRHLPECDAMEVDDDGHPFMCCCKIGGVVDYLDALRESLKGGDDD